MVFFRWIIRIDFFWNYFYFLIKGNFKYYKDNFISFKKVICKFFFRLILGYFGFMEGFRLIM